jgi:hypothetical protein
MLDPILGCASDILLKRLRYQIHPNAQKVYKESGTILRQQSVRFIVVKAPGLLVIYLAKRYLKKLLKQVESRRRSHFRNSQQPLWRRAETST